MRMSSTGSKFFVQSGALGTASAAATTITKAAPVVMTFAAPPAGIVKGDVVQPQATGWKSIDNWPFFISDLTGNAVTLYSSDATREASAALLGTLREVTFAEICVATFALTGPAGTTVELTTLCDVARVTAAGLPGQVTWAMTGFWDASDANQQLLLSLYKSGKNTTFKVMFPDGSGVVFLGNVNSFNVGMGVDQAITLNMGGNVSGPVNMMPVDPTLAAGLQMAEPLQEGQPMMQPPSAPPQPEMRA